MVKPTLKPGMTEETTIATTPEMGVAHLGPAAVYSTPSMIGLMEGTALKLLTPHLDAGEQSVGYRVDVRHLAGTPIGQKVTARATLREIDGRKAIFDVEAHNEGGVKIGDGMHERRIIDISRFTQGAGAKT